MQPQHVSPPSPAPDRAGVRLMLRIPVEAERRARDRDAVEEAVVRVAQQLPLLVP